MPVKINGATSGSVTLAAPATGSDVTLTLPSAAGTVQTVPSWTSFTPTLSQNGTRTATVTYAKYIQLGKLVICNIRLDVTQAGSAGSNIYVSTPVTAAAITYGIGSFTYIASGARYAGAVGLDTENRVFFQVSGNTNALGIAPSFATANGDILSMSFTYEAA